VSGTWVLAIVKLTGVGMIFRLGKQKLVKNKQSDSKCNFMQYVFLVRDSICAIARYMPLPVRLSVCPFVCLSVSHTGGSVKDG